MAIENLNSFYNIDEKSAQSILRKPVYEFRNMNCLQMGSSGEILNFMKIEAVYKCLNEIWYHKLDYKGVSETASLKNSDMVAIKPKVIFIKMVF